MINGNLVQQIRLTTKDIVFVENDMDILVIHPENGVNPVMKLTDRKDILELRDMLIRAYPLEGEQCGT